jgi:hypothetical protein
MALRIASRLGRRVARVGIRALATLEEKEVRSIEGWRVDGGVEVAGEGEGEAGGMWISSLVLL